MSGQFLRLSSFWLNKNSPPVADKEQGEHATAIDGMPNSLTAAADVATAGSRGSEIFYSRESEVLDTVESSEFFDEQRHLQLGISLTDSDDEHWQGDLPPNWFSWRKLWAFTGPGLLMSIAYIDPGNLESDLQAGARTGYTLGWVLMWSTIMGYVVQTLALKLGVATGEHLAVHCRREYPPLPRYALWIMTEIAIIGSDIQEVIGSAIAIALLSNGAVPLWAGVVITSVDAFLFLFIERLGVRRLEAFFASLISIMALSFGYMYFAAHVPFLQVAQGLLMPKLPITDVSVAVGIVGAVIMPHNIYLHSALVQSRKINMALDSRKKEAMAYYGIESAFALLVSLFINVFVLSVFAKGFFGKGVEDIGLENAAYYLSETFGAAIKYIWAIGLLAAGQTSTMTGTYTGQFVMSGFLNLKISPALRVCITRAVALAPTLLVALSYRRRNDLDVLNQWLNILQSIQLPFAVLPVLMMTSSKRIMGPAFVNSPWLTGVTSAIALMVLAINTSLVYKAAQEYVNTRLHMALLIAVGAAYVALVGYLVIGAERWRRWVGGSFADGNGPKPDGPTEPLLDSID